MTDQEPEPSVQAYGCTELQRLLVHKLVRLPVFGFRPGCTSPGPVVVAWLRLSDVGESLERCSDCFPNQQTSLD